MKDIEAQETQRTFLRGLPVYVRIDGRGFSKFTKGMNRPYDERMSKLMTATAKYLMHQTQSIFCFTQSDEISLVFYNEEIKSDLLFNRRIMKLSSVLPSMAASFFSLKIKDFFGDDAMKYEGRFPHFDARVVQFPSKVEVANMILWRTADATKNAVSMAAQSEFSHKSLQNKSSSQMQERLFQERGINFNDYPRFFKQGVFLAKRYTERPLSEEIIAKIPEHKRATTPAVVKRASIEEIEMPIFSKVINRTEVIFNGAEPTVAV